jgi:hypothetical protein
MPTIKKAAVVKETRPALSGSVASRPEVSVLHCTIDRGENGFGVEVADSRGACVVCRLVGGAAAAGVLEMGDRITHVEGDGPLDYSSVVDALRTGPSPVALTVVRGEKLPSPTRRPSGKQTAALATLFALGLALMWMYVDIAAWAPAANGVFGATSRAQNRPRAAAPRRKRSSTSTADDDWEAEWEQEDADDSPYSGIDGDRVSSVGQSQEPPPSEAPRKLNVQKKLAVQVNGQRFDVEDDGTPEDPDGLRSAMRADFDTMSMLRKEKPEWARIITGNADGSYDRATFVKIMRENRAGHRSAEDTQLNDDGTAKNPEGYLAVLKREPGRKVLKSIKERDAELHARLIKGDVEALQDFLRASKASADMEQERERMPPPPPTPYDDIGKVGMSMRILTDEGEEKDLYQLMADETDEEKWTFPPYMQCAACEAVAHQAALAVSKALRTKYDDDLVGTTTLEALETLCADKELWSTQYGIVPTGKGINAIKGDGITVAGDLEGNMDVMLATQHNHEWGKKLMAACQRYVLGADAPEEMDIASMSQESTLRGDENDGAARFREVLCTGPNDPCEPRR